ncbi:hypothetical protein [Streptomyces sp. NPDC086787]|uniref:hypothetical protein n=1 Tax=Streptomyces sp. NPDC086787 TaxID=3365759 RepID=UPI0037F8CF03
MGDKAITKATGASLGLTSAQRGRTITVKVTAHRTGHSDGTATSKPTAKIPR